MKVEPHASNTSYTTAHVLKETSFMQPLLTSSLHSPHVHRSWAVLCLKRAEWLSESSDSKLEATATIRERLVTAGASLYTVGCTSRVLARLRKGFLPRKSKIQHTMESEWRALQAHPLMRRQLPKAIAALSNDYGNMLSAAFRDSVRVLMSWESQ